MKMLRSTTKYLSGFSKFWRASKTKTTQNLESLAQFRPVDSNELIETWVPPQDPNFTVLQIFNTLPGYKQSAIPFILKVFENPKSPICLSGSCGLYEHDCIHIALGRGLIMQDESFILGYSMGNDERLRQWELEFYKFTTRKFYPKEYLIDDVSGVVFDMAAEYGMRNPIKNIHIFPFLDYLNRPVGELRDKLGIKESELKEYFQREKELFPNRIASARLHV